MEFFKPKDDIIRKVYYAIGEVSIVTGIEVHTLRKWEKQYGYPKSKRNGSHHRKYEYLDILIFQTIQNLLVEYNNHGVAKHLPAKVKELQANLKGNKQQLVAIEK